MPAKKTIAKKKPATRSAAAAKTVKQTVKKTTRRVVKPKVEPVIIAPRETVRPMVGPLTAVKNFWRGYFNLVGRATRSEFWFGLLFMIAVNWAFAVLGMHGHIWETIATIVSAVLFIPTLTLTIRRFRDAGVSVWLYIIPMLFVYLIPIVRGSVWGQLIALGYVSSGMLAYSGFVFIYLLFVGVVACLASKKK